VFDDVSDDVLPEVPELVPDEVSAPVSDEVLSPLVSDEPVLESSVLVVPKESAQLVSVSADRTAKYNNLRFIRNPH
jgi:hypothetical protein